MEATAAALDIMCLDVAIGLHWLPFALNLCLHARQLLLHLTQLQQAQENMLKYTYNRQRKKVQQHVHVDRHEGGWGKLCHATRTSKERKKYS